MLDWNTPSIEFYRAAGAVPERSLCEVAVDTTVMEKAIAHPTDSRLLERARAQLVDLARESDARRCPERAPPRRGQTPRHRLNRSA